MRAVILAGGKGTRLRPYTSLLPKPLVPIGGEKSVIEVIIEQLARAGVTHITIAVNHLAHLIMSFIGNGERWGITIDYSLEDKPLSTIGPLKLIQNLPEQFLVLNGDILTDLDFRRLYDSHCARGSDVTVATFKRIQKIDYGVIETDEQRQIIGFREKPESSYSVSMGVYVLNRRVLDSVPSGVPYGFDTLMYDCIAHNRPATSYLWEGFWLDIGRPEDYDFCNQNYEDLRRTLNL
jgi:NDP-sugar pyrophosphorylase family protein